jgi:glycerate kinase
MPAEKGLDERFHGASVAAVATEGPNSVYRRHPGIFVWRLDITPEPRILICPDALKETTDAVSAAKAIALGVRNARPDATSHLHPLADGGEGTLDVLAATMPTLAIDRLQVSGPRPDRPSVVARFGVTTCGSSAAVELAEAAGIERLAIEDRDPERTGTAGVGELLAEARRRLVHPTVDVRREDRAPEVILTLGGSGTVDGGLGALRSLGVEIIGPDGDPTRPLVGADLGSIIDIRVPEAVRSTWSGVRLRILVDVTNPLLGPIGAAVVFGPQKGADAAAVARLEAGMEHLGRLLEDRFGLDPETPGAGAAGGIGAALSAVLGGRIEPGFDAIADRTGFDEALASCSLVITSEGRLDRQSLMGKVLGGVLARAESLRIPVIAVPGSVASDLPAEARRRFAAIRSLEETVGGEQARLDALGSLQRTTEAALETFRA